MTGTGWTRLVALGILLVAAGSLSGFAEEEIRIKGKTLASAVLN